MSTPHVHTRVDARSVELLLDDETVRGLTQLIYEMTGAPTALVSISNRILAVAQRAENFRLPIQSTTHHIIPIRYDAIEVGAVVIERSQDTNNLESKGVKGLFLRQRAKLDDTAATSVVDDSRLCRLVEALLGYAIPLGVRAKAANILKTSHADDTLRQLAENHQNLRQDYDRLIEADRIRNAIMSRVSHELRTPLTSILGYSELLLGTHPPTLTAQQESYIRTIQTKGEELFEQLTRLLDYSEIENDAALTLEVSRVTVARVLDTLKQIYAPKAEAKAVSLSFDLKEINLSLDTDEKKLIQVLRILLDNAIKYTKANGKVTLCAARVERSSGMRMVEFRVIDTGVGIAKEHLEHVFDAFYHVGEHKHSSATSGIGLGLSVAKKLIDALGATVKIESKLGWGTHVVVAIHADTESV